jgi:hypothetical protein
MVQEQLQKASSKIAELEESIIAVNDELNVQQKEVHRFKKVKLNA